MPNPVVITVVDGVLTLADTQAGLTTGAGFECQVTSAAINAAPNLQTVPATFCSPQSQTPASTSYELAVNWLQDWRAPGGGLSGYAFTNDTLEKWFELKLDADDTAPIATGVVRIVAGSFGGEAGTPLETSTVWPVQGKPTITVPPITVTAGAGTDEAGGVPNSADLDVRDDVDDDAPAVA